MSKHYAIDIETEVSKDYLAILSFNISRKTSTIFADFFIGYAK